MPRALALVALCLLPGTAAAAPPDELPYTGSLRFPASFDLGDPAAVTVTPPPVYRPRQKPSYWSRFLHHLA